MNATIIAASVNDAKFHFNPDAQVAYDYITDTKMVSVKKQAKDCTVGIVNVNLTLADFEMQYPTPTATYLNFDMNVEIMLKGKDIPKGKAPQTKLFKAYALRELRRVTEDMTNSFGINPLILKKYPEESLIEQSDASNSLQDESNIVDFIHDMKKN